MSKQKLLVLSIVLNIFFAFNTVFSLTSEETLLSDLKIMDLNKTIANLLANNNSNEKKNSDIIKEIFDKEKLKEYFQLKNTLKNITGYYSGDWSSDENFAFMDANKGTIIMNFSLQKSITFSNEFYYQLNFNFKLLSKNSKNINTNSSSENSDFFVLIKKIDDNFISNGELSIFDKNSSDIDLYDLNHTNNTRVLTFKNFDSTIEKVYAVIVYENICKILQKSL